MKYFQLLGAALFVAVPDAGSRRQTRALAAGVTAGTPEVEKVPRTETVTIAGGMTGVRTGVIPGATPTVSIRVSRPPGTARLAGAPGQTRAPR